MQRLLHEQVYLDTNIFIAMVEAFNAKAIDLFRAAEQGLVYLVTSEITRGEVLLKPMQNENMDLVQRYQELFDNSTGLTPLAADGTVMREAATFAATSGLELIDAVHCATAEAADCAFVISQDKDMRHYSPIDVLSLDELGALA